MAGLLVNDSGGVRRIYFDRPEKLNAITHEDVVAARGLIEEAYSMDAIVFGGTGDRAFSAGIHVDTFAGLSPGEARRFIGDLGAMIAAARRAPAPTICAVGGYCIGGAMELAMACDIRVAVRTASFGMPEIKVGIPSVLDAALLQQHVGLGKAKEMLLTGDLYGAEELDRYGFINRLVEPEELEAEVDRMLARLTGHSKVAVAAQKRLFETWQNTGLGESINASMGEFALVFGEEETRRRVEGYRRG